MPRWPEKKTIEAAELPVGQPDNLVLPGQGDGEINRTDLNTIETEPAALSGKRAEDLEFAETFVDVVVHESTDPNADDPVMVYCNGTPQFFLRGKTQRVRRKYVEVLARAKVEAIKTVDRPQMGDTVIQKARSLRYPFSVSDPDPRGHQWLQNIMASS